MNTQYIGKNQLNDYNKRAFKKLKSDQLRTAYKTINEAVEDIKNNPAFFVEYLTVQSNFDRYTARNAMLIAKKMPTATQLKERKKWLEMGARFRTTYPTKVIILDPKEPYQNKTGYIATSFYAKEMIDVSETNIRPTIRNYDKKLILQALINECTREIKVVDNLENDKLCEWNNDEQILYICRSDNQDLTIYAVATEIAKIEQFENTEQIDEDKAKCIAYMICKKYGVMCQLDNATNMCDKYSTMESKEVINDLTIMKDFSSNIITNMGLFLSDRTKENKYETREEAR